MVELKDRYENPPLIEIAMEIKFQLNHSIPIILGSFQKTIQDEYPIASELFSKKVSLAQIGQATDQPAVYEFYANNTKKEIVRIRKDSLGFITKRYSDYKDFKQKINFVLKKFSEVVNKEPEISLDFTRLGLRYINLLEIPDNNLTRFDKLFVNPFSTDFSDSSKFIQFDATLFEKMVHKDVNYNFRTKAAILKDNNQNLKYLLDFDVWKLLDNEELDDIIGITDNLHLLIKEKFASSINEEYTKIMEEDKDG